MGKPGRVAALVIGIVSRLSLGGVGSPPGALKDLKANPGPEPKSKDSQSTVCQPALSSIFVLTS